MEYFIIIVMILLPSLLIYQLFRSFLHFNGIWRWIASIPVMMLGTLGVDVLLRPHKHHLLPFEVIILVIFGLVFHAITVVFYEKLKNKI